MDHSTVSVRAGLDLEGAQWLVLLQEKYWGEAVSTLGFSPKMEQLYACAIKGNWFSYRAMRLYGWVVVDEVDNKGVDEYMALVPRAEFPAAVSPILLVAEVRPDMRVGPRCFVPLSFDHDERVLEIKREVATADTSRALVYAGSEEPPVMEVDASGRPSGSQSGELLPVGKLDDKCSAIMTDTERKEFFSVVAEATSSAIVDSGYCYKVLFAGSEAERVAQVLGPQPSLYKVAMCYADAIARGTAVSGCEVTVVDASCAHVTRKGNKASQDILAKMVTLLYRDRNFTVGQSSDAGSWFSYDDIGWNASSLDVRVGACVNSRTGDTECDACARKVVSHRKGAMFGKEGVPLQNFARDRRLQSVVVLRPDLMQNDHFDSFDRNPYDDEDIDVEMERNLVGELYSWRTDPGVWTLEVQDVGGCPVVDVGGRSMLALPPNVEFSISDGGTQVFTGNTPMCVIVTGEVRVFFRHGVAVGDLLAVRVGDVSQMRRWLHIYAGIDPAETSAVRYWSAFKVPVAIANLGPTHRSIDGAEVGLAELGAPHAKKRINGVLTADSWRALTVVGAARGVRVQTCGGVKVDVPDRRGVIVLDSRPVECEGDGIVCELIDEYVVDDGGPSPSGGFYDEFYL